MLLYKKLLLMTFGTTLVQTAAGMCSSLQASEEVTEFHATEVHSNNNNVFDRTKL